ncbi:cell wall-binding repeat-containing protein [Kineococcus gypseus]|uniref:cell wall-binding repeat-containing protein n=1 Tax=Kineococcus gypseus TaxID=1637102 RepID=UPI003D7DF438
MRAKIAAVLTATALTGAALAGAGSATADSAPARSTPTTGSTTGSTTEGSNAKAAAPLRELRRAAADPAGVLRLAGADRYATAVEVSRSFWEPDTAAVVTLASGTSFPDALAAGPSVTGFGPVLLTERDLLPEVTRAELERLRPCEVIVLGGAATVSEAVAADAARYTDPAACGF